MTLVKSGLSTSVHSLGLLLIASLLSGCGGRGGEEFSRSLGGTALTPALAIRPATIQVRAGGTQQFSLAVSRGHVVWSVNGVEGGDSTLGTIDAKGTYRAPSTVPVQHNVLRVTATSVAKVSASALVTLCNPLPIVTLVSPTTISVGTFVLNVNGMNFVPGAEVLFAGEVLESSFVSPTHLVATGTANQSQLGKVQILVKNPDPGSANSASGSTVKVTSPLPIQVSVSPSRTNILLTKSRQFAATLQHASNPAVNWSVNGVPGGDATLGIITPTGLYTAPAALPRTSSVTVTATSVGNSVAYGTAAVILQSPAVTSRTVNYYVNATSGDDSYDGTSSTYVGGDVGPWLTLRKAGLTVTAGATVHVADGSYNVDGMVASLTSIETKMSGSPDAWITYISDNKWGAKIVNTNTLYANNNIAWVVEGDYQIIKNFDISGGPYNGIFVDGNHVQLIGNHLHDMLSTSCVNGAFIYVNSPYQYVDTIGNVMHDGGMKPWPSDCGNWHGIYYGGVTNGAVQYGQISNNIIYRISGFGIHFWHKVSHIDVLNNLMFSNVHGGIVVGASDGATNDYFKVENNMIIYNSNMFDNAHGPASLGWAIEQYVNGGTIGPHNDYLNNLLFENHSSNGGGGNWANEAVGTDPTGVVLGTVAANPLLINYQNSPSGPMILNGKVIFPGADYQPTSGSPARNACDPSNAPSTNIDGASRDPRECVIGPY